MKRIYFLLAIIPALMTVLMYSNAFALTTEADIAQHMRSLDEQRSETSEPTYWVEEKSTFVRNANRQCSNLYDGDKIGYQNCMYVRRKVRDAITDQRWKLD